MLSLKESRVCVFWPVASGGTERILRSGDSDGSLDQAHVPEKTRSRSTMFTKSVGARHDDIKNTGRIAHEAIMEPSQEHMVEGVYVSSSPAKKAVKFNTQSNSISRHHMDDTGDSTRERSMLAAGGTTSIGVGPPAASKKGSRRYSVDDCGVHVAPRPEPRRSQVTLAFLRTQNDPQWGGAGRRMYTSKDVCRIVMWDFSADYVVVVCGMRLLSSHACRKQYQLLATRVRWRKRCGASCTNR